jgi:hypothetical protein
VRTASIIRDDPWQSTINLHGSTTQKTALNIILAAVRTWNLIKGCLLSYFLSQCVRLYLTQVERWRHSVSDVVEYVTTEKVTTIYFQHTSCIFIRQWEIRKQWVYTGWLFLMLKLSSWKKEWTSPINFINWEFLTGCLLTIINRTRAFLKFKMAARLSRLLYLKSELLSWPLHSIKRKPLLAQLSNCHNNRGKNVYSILPYLRETNRINRQFVYI